MEDSERNKVAYPHTDEYDYLDRDYYRILGSYFFKTVHFKAGCCNFFHHLIYVIDDRGYVQQLDHEQRTMWFIACERVGFKGHFYSDLNVDIVKKTDKYYKEHYDELKAEVQKQNEIEREKCEREERIRAEIERQAKEKAERRTLRYWLRKIKNKIGL